MVDGGGIGAIDGRTTWATTVHAQGTREALFTQRWNAANPMNSTTTPVAAEAAPPVDERGMPAEPLRSALTLMLFFHLFCLFVAVVGNRPYSSLLRVLHNAPGPHPYLQAIGFDLSYRFALMHGTAGDRGWTLACEYKTADGKTGTYSLPEKEVGGLQYEHQYALVRLMGELEESEQAVIAQSVGTRLLKDLDAQEVLMRLQGRMLLSQQEVVQGRTPAEASLVENVYQAKVSLLPDGRVVFIKVEGRAADSAPTARPSASSGAVQPGASSTGSGATTPRKPAVPRPPLGSSLPQPSDSDVPPGK